MKTNLYPSPDVNLVSLGYGNAAVFALSAPQKIIVGLRKEIVQMLIHTAIFKIVIRHHRNPVTIFKIIQALIRLRRKVLGDFKIKKAAYVDGKYYWDLYAPGYGSKAFEQYIEGEINRISTVPGKTNRFTNVFIALTKKCALQCEHCFEWEALNGNEKLTLQDIKKIVHEFQNRGTAQIQLTGGEPILRVDDIIDILNSSKPETDFWVLTSGMNLTLENAQKLKNAGLTGVVVSLDHFEANQHNQFRGHKKSYVWAEAGVKNSIAANLVTVLSICVTKSFVTQENLMSYSKLAKTWGVSFIQILEPRSVGHYKGMDVVLGKKQEELLKDFYFKMNCEKKYSTYPIIVYHGYHQRQTGCFSSGNRNLYVDTDGDIHACPFCQKKTGNVLSGELDSSIETLRATGCHVFETYTG
jgi:MoaA/NifB/PqqE/SkfB family radical SAM enzyme